MGAPIQCHFTAWSVEDSGIDRVAELLAAADRFAPCKNPERRYCRAVTEGPIESSRHFPIPAYHFHTDYRYPEGHGDDTSQTGRIFLYRQSQVHSPTIPGPPIGFLRDPQGNEIWDDNYMTTSSSEHQGSKLAGGARLVLNCRGGQDPTRYPVKMLRPGKCLQNAIHLWLRDFGYAISDWWHYQYEVLMTFVLKLPIGPRLVHYDYTIGDLADPFLGWVTMPRSSDADDKSRAKRARIRHEFGRLYLDLKRQGTLGEPMKSKWDDDRVPWTVYWKLKAWGVSIHDPEHEKSEWVEVYDPDCESM
ncbi:uncharacterized protein BO95DRAFT_490083 [Aspergillus brunneoviolaceus CBS 621.78]|uniref:Uncharacterized protein n=1 Tax=Aspergillus brunneoviolaceus CBS 621.78 TaxID=1450534 RepID=A0ACD1GHM9_9EURO|nr:hypothetical protein BO95DRAFT_490083 [Aspergillus brunneoviolaceus CBS 621.78]RAH48722.1 hypothetical protein BO95DRAFT_490083 [Aspergillus brunneoviolaceus CBS 621.78]